MHRIYIYEDYKEDILDDETLVGKSELKKKKRQNQLHLPVSLLINKSTNVSAIRKKLKIPEDPVII